MDAISSMPFLLAAYLLDGEVTLKTLSADSRARQDILALAQKITHRTNDRLTTGFDGLVEVRIHSGRIYSLAAADQTNDDARVLKKFEANLAFANPRKAIASHTFGQQVLGEALPDWRVVRDILATCLET
jgi:2-methylcitrate dehydratase PrpD